MKVRILETFAQGAEGGMGVAVYHPGQELEIGDDLAIAWMSHGRAESVVAAPELAVMPVRSEKAVRNARPAGDERRNHAIR